MKKYSFKWICAIFFISQTQAANALNPVTTFDEIQPILNQHCIMCHSGNFAPLGLKLDSFEALLNGSSRGPVAVSGNPSQSEIIHRLKGTSQPRMPMTGPPFLSDNEVSLFENWILSGMPKGNTGTRQTASASHVPPPASKSVTYRQVAPIFARRCSKCHTENGLMGAAPEGYQLTSYELTLSANDRVRVVPGMPDASELVRRIRGQAYPKMPFDGPPYLAQNEILLIEQWIREGAKNSSGQVAPFPEGKRIRLHGILRNDMTLDGLPLIIPPASRIKKAPSAGDYVQVRGYLTANGGVIVERLRRR